MVVGEMREDNLGSNVMKEEVPQVTEETAVAVLNLYPTVLSLARAYSLLDGDVSAQEDMLRKQSSNAVSAVASRNIFQLVWGNDH
uniref:Crossover junction endonuclease MUS81 n=1 Tax=Salix viminalis TaxID=40686 RepID=A0A6N2NEM5_SALVM